MEFRDYIRPDPLPKIKLDIKKQEGNVKEGIPNYYTIGDRTIKGIQLGEERVGHLIVGEGKRKGYSLPGAHKAIKGYVGRDDLKAGGSDKYGWDKDDIHWFDWARGVRVKDIENAEKTDQKQLLDEKFKNTRFAGTAFGPQFGDREYIDEKGNLRNTVQDRIDQNRKVKTARVDEPIRLNNELGTARRLVESQNRDIRAEDFNNVMFAATENARIDADKLKKLTLDQQDESRKEDVAWRQKRADIADLNREADLRRELAAEKREIERDRRNYDFEMRRYEDMLDYREEKEEKDRQRYLMESVGNVLKNLGTFF